MTAWLARIQLDTRNRDVRRDLADAVRMHKRVMTLAPDDIGEHARSHAGVLYRLDETRTGPQLLIQTGCKPDATRLPDDYGTFDVRDITPLLDMLEPGHRLAYRLAANTTKRLGRHAGKDEGKVVPLTGEAIEQWWYARAPGCGLTLTSLRSDQQHGATGQRDTNRVRHTITRFDGTATVTDHKALRAALLAGIGRGKSYGCGLLSIAYLRGQP